MIPDNYRECEIGDSIGHIALLDIKEIQAEVARGEDLIIKCYPQSLFDSLGSASVEPSPLLRDLSISGAWTKFLNRASE
ncbi:MAG: hypothetical protein DRP45_09640 [Candidatus Zixiibacteriota bacterium]|nr:MAG: hypothetical protein DRP45_09640 [candidate division Zixibacteria bacterium]